MPRLILNRNLLSKLVPSFSYAEIDELASGEPAFADPFPYARAQLAWFRRSFDPDKCAADTGQTFGSLREVRELIEKIDPIGRTDIGLNEARWALWTGQFDGQGADRLLNAIHWIVAGSKRETSGSGPFEPWMGKKPMQLASGQRRFELTTGLEFDRHRLFDFVAGLLLRQYGDRQLIRALGLYPPVYQITDDFTWVRHGFMFLLQRLTGESTFEPNGDTDEQILFADLARCEALRNDIGVLAPPEWSDIIDQADM